MRRPTVGRTTASGRRPGATRFGSRPACSARADWRSTASSPSTAAPHDGAAARVPAAGGVRCWSATVRRARVYATAHGVYDLEVNGRRVGDDLLAPGLDQLPPPPAGIARTTSHRSCGRGGERPRRLARRRLVPRAARVQRRSVGHLRHGRRGPGRSSSSRTTTGRADGPAHLVVARPRPSPPRDSTRASRTTPASSPRMVDARLRRRRTGRRPTILPRGRHSTGTLEAPTGPPVRVIDVLRSCRDR